jgi:hypothetical protein
MLPPHKETASEVGSLRLRPRQFSLRTMFGVTFVVAVLLAISNHSIGWAIIGPILGMIAIPCGLLGAFTLIQLPIFLFLRAIGKLPSKFADESDAQIDR